MFLVQGPGFDPLHNQRGRGGLRPKAPRSGGEPHAHGHRLLPSQPETEAEGAGPRPGRGRGTARRGWRWRRGSAKPQRRQ